MESQKEAESQRASQSQMSSTVSQDMRNEILLIQKNGSGDQSWKEVPQRISIPGNQSQSQPATKPNPNKSSYTVYRDLTLRNISYD
jgi:hypothetical protein